MDGDHGYASHVRFAAAPDRRGRVEAALLQGAGAATVAVFAYVTANRLPFMRETYWAPIAAVVVLYRDDVATRRAGVDRFFGTAIGCVVGWIGATYWHQNVLIYGLSVLTAVSLCDLLGLENASRLCAVAVTVITIIPRAEPAYLVAFYRFVEVSYGVACALAYTTLVSLVRHRCMDYSDGSCLRRRIDPEGGSASARGPSGDTLPLRP